MNIESRFLLSIITASIMTKFVVGSMTSGEKLNPESITEFIDEIKSIEEHKNNTQRHKCSMIRIINRKIAISDMILVYQRLFGEIENEETLTVITIIHMENDQVFSSVNYYRNFVYALRKHMKNNEKYITMSRNLAVSVDYVEKTHLNDYSCVDETTEQLLNLTNDFSVFMITSMFDICYVILKYIITNDIWVYFYSLLESKPDLIYTCDKKLRNHSKEYLQHLEKVTNRLDIDKMIYDGIYKFAYDRSIYFEKLCIKFSKQNPKKYDDKVNNGKDEFLFKCWQIVLLDKHVKEFIDYLKDMVCILRPLIKFECYNYLFCTLFAESFNGNCAHPSDGRTSDAEKPLFLREYILGSSQRLVFMNRCDLFFESIGLHEQQDKIVKTHKTRNAMLCQEYSARKTAKIILDSKMDVEKCIGLQQMLKNTNFFDKLNQREMILFIDGKRIKRNNLLAGARKYSSKKFTLDIDREYKVFDSETLEVLTTRCHQIDANTVTNQIVLWTSKDPVESIESQLYADLSSLAPPTTISIGKYNECDDLFNKFLEELVNTANSTVENVHCIVLRNVCEEVTIYCIHSKVVDTDCEMLSLLYKINSKYSTDLTSGVHSTNCTTTWIYNVAKPMLDNLVSNIKCYLTTTKTNFTIPNICTINNSNHIYCVRDVKYSNHKHKSYALKEYFQSQSVPIDCEIRYTKLSMQSLMDYKFKSGCVSYRDMFEIISSVLVLEKRQLFETVSVSVLNRQGGEFMDKNFVLPGRMHENIDIEFYVTREKDCGQTLQICERTRDQKSISFLHYLPRIYQNLLANKEITVILSLFKQIEVSIGCEKSIVFSILLDMCTKLTAQIFFGITSNFSFDCDQYSKILFGDIERIIFGSNLKKGPSVKQESTRLVLRSLQQSITLSEISRFVEVIARELGKITYLWTLQVTSVRMNKVHEYEGLDYYQSFCGTNNGETCSVMH